MTLVQLGIAWLAGIWLASRLDGPLAVWLGTAGVAITVALLLRRHPTGRLLFMALAALALGGARYATAVPTIDSAHVAYYNGSPNLTLTGIVSDEPDVRDRSTNLRVRVTAVTLPGGTTQTVDGLVLARVPRFPAVAYGSRVTLRGALEIPPEDESFSYKDYLARQGIFSMLDQPRLTVLAEGEGQPFYHAIFAVKARAHAVINAHIPAPQSALLSGILLGDDNGLPRDLSDAFRATGLTHIIAISGFNIAILTAILAGLCEPFMPRRAAALVAMFGIAVYTLLVGADASVVRAALMGSIFLLATRWIGRPNFAYASLFLAAVVMTLANPNTLWDVGFQLSFTATLGLMLYATPFTRWTEQRLNRYLDRDIVKRLMGLLSEAVLITLAAQVLTLPLMIAYFGEVSLISLVANAFVLPAQPGVMLWGGLATLSGMLVPAVGQLFSWLAWLFLSYTIALVRLFAAVPGAVVPINVPTAGIVALYLAIAAITWLAKAPDLRRRVLDGLQQQVAGGALAAGSLGALLLVGSWGLSQPDGLLHVAFLDVGQGDATLIQTPAGRQILVDGGQFPSRLMAHLGDQLPFWDRQIDLVVATHPDDDHVAGLTAVFDRYAVDQLITNGQGSGQSEAYDALLQAARSADTRLHTAVAGETIDLGDGVRLELLHPDPAFSADGDNDRSVVARLVYGDFALLLPGDAEANAEAALLAQPRPLQATVLKAAHHGANTSSSPALLTAVQPHIVVVSAGPDNRFGHPHPEMLARAQAQGAAVLRTDELGTLTLTTDGATMWWQGGPPRALPQTAAQSE